MPTPFPINAVFQCCCVACTASKLSKRAFSLSPVSSPGTVASRSIPRMDQTNRTNTGRLTSGVANNPSVCVLCASTARRSGDDDGVRAVWQKVCDALLFRPKTKRQLFTRTPNLLTLNVPFHRFGRHVHTYHVVEGFICLQVVRASSKHISPQNRCATRVYMCIYEPVCDPERAMCLP